MLLFTSQLARIALRRLFANSNKKYLLFPLIFMVAGCAQP